MHRLMKILIMHRDAGEQTKLVRLLDEQAAPGNYQILTSENADEAIKIFRRRHPDLILIGTHSLDQNGRDLCARVRLSEGKRHTGIIFIAEGVVDEDQMSVECLELGADDFLREDCSSKELMARVKAVLRLKAMTDELRSANHKLHVLSMTDELTGLANMRSFNRKFGEMVRRCRGGRIALGVIMLDLDHFKLVNDTTNHLVGSFVISEVGRLLRQEGLLGENDTAARYGGDEFIIALEVATAEMLCRKAEEIRRLVGKSKFQRDGFTISITSSQGAAWVDAGFHGRAEDIIKAADLMLYRSKHYGRDRVSGMVLRYPVDLENISQATLVSIDAELQDQDAALQKS